MATESQHGKHCSCVQCHASAVIRQTRNAERVNPPVWRETATVEQLRLGYETALDEMQMLVESGPLERETRIECMRRYLTEAGRKLR